MQLMQILFDIRYFMIVMLVVIFMFGDMFHFAVSTADQGKLCEQEGLADPTEDFCVPTTATPSYLRVYVSECSAERVLSRCCYLTSSFLVNSTEHAHWGLRVK
jgi:hypothetical protein